MSCKYRRPLAAAGVFALAVIAGMSFVPVSSASPGHAVAEAQSKSPGLTEQSIVNARAQGDPGPMMTMEPQSSFELLAHATKLGPHARNSTIEITVALKLRNVSKLKNFLEQVQNPQSSLYHQWLTPSEFTRLYGPAKADVAEVVDFIKAHHIRVLDVSPNRMLIHTAATTTAYEHAFSIRINDYKLDGRRFYSTTDHPKIPHTIAPHVINLLGLNRGAQMRSFSYYRPLVSAHDLSPRQAPAASLTNLNPLQIAHAYNYPDITDAANGAGVNVAILTANSSGLATLGDPHDFWAAFGLPDHTINVIPVGGDKGDNSGMGETLLDVEYSGAMGPGIIQNVYVAADASFGTFTDMYNRFANDTNPDGTARNQVMSTSWGAPDIAFGDAARTTEQIFLQAAAEGISMFAAAGDHGSGDGVAGEDNVADYPSSSAYITSANGTQLNISDLDGTYGSEIVWNDANCFGNGPLLTGGAVSQIIERPDWQVGPGVPADIDMRMNSDLAATASCTKPMFVLGSGRWGLTAGTSAVAPQLAGMFSILVARNDGEPVGQSNELIYNDANINYASDFRDVTVGNNGAFTAGPNWDHPTGWGSPNVENLLSHLGIQGPKGRLVGTVTDKASGAALAGADVTAVESGADGRQFSTRTRDDGTYAQTLPAGNFNVTVSAFGYSEGTASVSIADDASTTQDFALQAGSTAKISGRVTDGAGHGYGLYANIRVVSPGFGQVADVWTDPTTGRYSVSLPEGGDYTLNVASAINGYNSDSETVVNLSGATTQDFSLAIASSCSAPGYTFGKGFGQGFNGGVFPPEGWEVTHTPTDSVVWKPSTDQPTHSGNYTGGSGAAADADSGDFGVGVYDTALITPPIPVTSLPSSPVLTYKANFQMDSGSEALDVDISTDGGSSWTNLSHWASNHGEFYSLPGVVAGVPLGPLPASGDIKLRWRYYNPVRSLDWYAQIDDVAIGSCMPVSGGLVFGQVTEASSGSGIVGATITDEQGHSTKTVANPADPNFPVGSYLAFVPDGDHVLTARNGAYFDTAEITLSNNQVLTQNFSIKKPEYVTQPGELTVDVMVNSQVTKALTINNIGQGPGNYGIAEINAPPPASAAAVPTITVKGRFTPASRAYALAHGSLQSNPLWQQPSGAPPSNPWKAIADFPGTLVDGAAAANTSTGKIYVVGNAPASSQGFVYDPDSNSWAPIASMPIKRAAPVADFIDGKLYVVNGWDKGGAGNPVAELDVYDPVTDTWSTAAPNPVPAGGGSASAVVDGKLYVVGGCNDGSCGDPLGAVQVYDPATDSWDSAPDYPYGLAFLMCGSIEHKLYCVGGNGATEHADGYVFYPYSPYMGWMPITNVPVQGGGLWGAYSITSQGELLLSGGVTSNSSTVTNAGWSYNPITDTWSTLPNANYAMYRGASACGFYRIGGLLNGLHPMVFSAILPGHDMCDSGSMPIPWLTEAPNLGTVTAGASAVVSLTFDGANQRSYTTSEAYIKVIGAPDSVIVPLTVHWLPQPVDLTVTGRVTPMGPVKKDELLSYNLAVQNRQGNGLAQATETKLTYQVPNGLKYIAATGGANCVPSSDATVVCDFGTVQAGGSKSLLLAVQAMRDADTIESTFTVSARETESDPSDNSVTIVTDTNTGPTGPTGPGGPEGPQGPKGDKGSGGFGGLGLLLLLGLGAAVEWSRRRRMRQSLPSAESIKRGVPMKVTMTAMLVSLFVLPFAFGGAPALAASSGVDQLPGAQSLSADAGPALPAALRPVFYRSLARDTAAAYPLNEAGCTTLPRSALKGCFDADGAHFNGPGASALALHLLAYGREGKLSTAASVRPEVEGAQARYRHGAVTEWWRVLPIGFEQGFTLAERPAGDGAFTLVLGASRDAQRQADGLAWGKLSYGGLVVTDANGKMVPATLTSEGRRVLITVNDAQAVYPLVVDPLVWIEQKVTADDGTPGSQFGASLAVSGDTAVIGAPYAAIDGHNAQGAAYVFTRLDGSWSQTAKLAASDGAFGDQFGYSVAVSGDTAVIGAPFADIGGNSAQGAVYVFNKSGGVWGQTAKLVASDGAFGDELGKDLAYSGGAIIAGAMVAEVNGNRGQGAAYVFDESGGNWSQAAKLVADDGARNDHFGFSVAISGHTALVGAMGATVNGTSYQGAAYVFTESGGSWSQAAKLTAADGAQTDELGRAVALSGNIAVAGALYASIEGKRHQGAAYVFTDSDGSWSRTAKLIASDGEAGDQFGSSVAVSGDIVIVGAQHAAVNDNIAQGSVYVFTRTGGNWSQSNKLIVSDGAADDQFGSSVANSDSTFLIGAPLVGNESGSRLGAAYFYGGSDLALAMSVPASVSAGRTFISQSIVTNSSSVASPAVMATVTVPAAASFVSASSSQGSCNEDSGVVHCDFGVIDGNAGTATANVTLKAPDNTGATTLENSASLVKVSPALSAHAATEVRRLPVNLAVLGNVSPVGPVKNGDDLIYAVALQNLSEEIAAAATQTKMTYQIPDGLELVSTSGDASCAPSPDATVVCDFGVVLAGQSKFEKLMVQTTHDADTIESTFTVSARETESDPSDNSVTIVTDTNTGPTGPAGPGGPQGPQGSQGDKGSGGFGGLGLLLLLGLGAAVEWSRRRRMRQSLSSAESIKRYVPMKVTMTAMLVSLFVLPFMLGGAPAFAASSGVDQLPGAQSLAADAGPALPAALRPVFYRSLAHDTAAAYPLNEAGCTTLPRSALKGCFDADGAHFNGPGAAPLGLHLLAYGREGKLSTAASVRPEVEGAQARYRHGAVTEWWRVLPIGFEQGFTLAERPAGDGAFTLVLGASRDAQQRGDGLAWGKLSYGGLVVTDAEGKTVPATLTGEGRRVLITVNDAQAVYPLVVDPLVWIEQKVTADDGTPGSQFGASLAVSGDTAVIGAPYAAIDGHNSQGTAYVFTRLDGSWSQTAKLTTDDGAAGDRFGTTLAIAGKTILVGSPLATVNGNLKQGAVYVFTESGGNWSRTAKLTASDGAALNNFGQVVALSGTTAVIGEEIATVNGNRYQGAAYVFTESGGSWSQATKLTANDGSENARFGCSVAVSGGTVLVGAYGVTVNGNRLQGAAYVFTESGGSWNQVVRLTGSDGAALDHFGDSVALSGDTALVGAPFVTVDGNLHQGAAYVFTETGGSWSRVARLIANDGDANSGFGSSVDVAGGIAIVGVPNAVVNDNRLQGSVYVFARTGGNWSQSNKLIASDGVAGDMFGTSVAAFDGTFLVGTNRATVNGNRSQGAAYFYGGSNLDLVLSAPASVSAGRTFISQSIVTNSSSVVSPAVIATITVPAAASFVSANASQGTCSEDSGTVHCKFGAIDGNAGTATASLTFKAPGNEKATTLETTASIVNAAPPLSTHSATKVKRLPINLAILGNVSPVGPIKKGESLNFVVTVQNLAKDSGAGATQTRLTYQVPDGLEYVVADGDASCAPSSGSNGAVVPATAPSSGATIVCNFGTVRAGASKLQQLLVRATHDANVIESTFTVSAEEPDTDPGNNSITVSSNPDYGSTGPVGPTGPQGPDGSEGNKGDKGSGGFGWLALVTLLGLALRVTWVTRRQKR